MARGINKVILIGNLGKDPETRYMPNGGAVTNITVATSETWKDKQSGQKQERTEWHNVVFFNRLAEIVGEYLKKGSKIYLEGSLRTRKWQDKQGNDRYTTEIVGSEMQMLDSRGGSATANAAAQSQAQSNAPASAPNNQTPVSQNPDSGPAPMPPNMEPPVDGDFDDDIPF